MAQNTINFPESESSSAAAKHQKTYSAKELAEVFNTRREDFFGLNLEVVTLNWSPNYIFIFLKDIEDLGDMSDAIDWLILSWEEHHKYRESMDNIYSKELVEDYRIFRDHLQRFKDELTQRKVNHDRKAALKAKWLNSSRHLTATMDIQPANVELSSTQTVQPEFKLPQQISDEDNKGFRILLTDLPEEIRNIIVVSQKVFDVFVKQLNEDIWSIVETNKSLYCDPLRFLCNFHYITKRKTTREEFDTLLHAIVEKLQDEPSLLSSMGRSKLTSEKKIDRSYKCYACYKELPKMRDEIWQLIEPCEKLDESLQPVLDAMKEEERTLSKQSSLSAQSSSAI